MCIRINRNRMTAVDGDEPNGAGTQPNQLIHRAIPCDKDGFITARDGSGLTAQRLERGRTHEPAGNINVPSGIEREVVGGIITGATRLQYPKQLTVALVLGKKNVAAASRGKGLASEVPPSRPQRSAPHPRPSLPRRRPKNALCRIRHNHTFATVMLRLGVGLPAFMQLLGHKDVRMTLRYYKSLSKTCNANFTAPA